MVLRISEYPTFLYLVPSVIEVTMTIRTKGVKEEKNKEAPIKHKMRARDVSYTVPCK